MLSFSAGKKLIEINWNIPLFQVLRPIRAPFSPGEVFGSLGTVAFQKPVMVKIATRTAATNGNDESMVIFGYPSPSGLPKAYQGKKGVSGSLGTKKYDRLSININ